MDSTFLQPGFFSSCCCDYCPFVTPPPFCTALSHGGAIRTTKQHSRCNQSSSLFLPALFILLSPHSSPKLLFAESISVRGTSILQRESLKQVLLDCFFCLLLEQKQEFAFFLLAAGAELLLHIPSQMPVSLEDFKDSWVHHMEITAVVV